MTGVASGKKVGVTRLPSYRLYKLDGAGKISSAEWLDAADDAHAERSAREMQLDTPYEVWDRKRLVVRVDLPRR